MVSPVNGAVISKMLRVRKIYIQAAGFTRLTDSARAIYGRNSKVMLLILTPMAGGARHDLLINSEFSNSSCKIIQFILKVHYSLTLIHAII